MQDLFKSSLFYIDPLGHDFLMRSCLDKNLNMVKYALELKFDPNTCDQYNILTPLLILVKDLDWNSVLIANMLLKAGADPHKCNSLHTSAFSALNNACVTKEKIGYKNIIMKMFREGHII